MNLIFRLLLVILRARRGPRLGPLDESVIQARVLPTDLDLNLHLNNGRALTLMDLGRVDLMLRIGVVGELRRRRWNPVVASLTIRYRRALRLGERFAIHTRLLCWDERWLYLEQRFTRGGDEVARALVRAAFVGPAGRVAPQQLVDASPWSLAPPPVPEGVRRWMEAEEAIQSETPSTTYEPIG
ncbi:MAG: thioesterase family protein [Gemmatimonadetes bacterium]|nr:thioesterase family protein [Gemmatimonadota bacterium]